MLVLIGGRVANSSPRVSRCLWRERFPCLAGCGRPQQSKRYSTSEQLNEKQRNRPVAGTSGCTDSGIRYYAARSRKSGESSSYYAVAEKLHQFVVTDGHGHGGGACAAFCAGQLPRRISHAFIERVRQAPLDAVVDPISGIRLQEETAAADAWKDSVANGFGDCERAAVEEQKGTCGALFCAVARSGVYVGSIGIGQVAVGTEEGAASVMCDGASNPHCAGNGNEERRWKLADAEVLPLGPTRLLGGSIAKQKEPRFSGLPDVVRFQHSSERRYVVMASADVWKDGIEAPVNAAVRAYRSGRSPADAVLQESVIGKDVVVLVLVLPKTLKGERCELPPHAELSLR